MTNLFSEQFFSIVCDVQDMLKYGYRQKHVLPADIPPIIHGSDSLEAIAAEVASCILCPLSNTRTLTVPGTGVSNPDVLVIGEGPGKDEDESGQAFVGRAGQFLDTWLNAIELSRNTNCFIANIVKCRPPNNRDPLPQEKDSCLPYLERQIQLLDPCAILCLGRVSAQVLLNTETGIGALRSKEWTYHGIPLVATYHPSAVLRNMSLKRPVWEDLKLLRSILDNRK